jgi:hypothetical protein
VRLSETGAVAPRFVQDANQIDRDVAVPQQLPQRFVIMHIGLNCARVWQHLQVAMLHEAARWNNYPVAQAAKVRGQP